MGKSTTPLEIRGYQPQHLRVSLCSPLCSPALFSVIMYTNGKRRWEIGLLVDNMSLEGKRIVIAGGSGFLGTSMATEFFRAGAKVTVLRRSKQKLTGDWAYQVWDGRSIGGWIKSIDGSDAIVNLAGRTVNCIKTPDHQDEILRSRIESTRVLGQAMRMVNLPPPVWV